MTDTEINTAHPDAVVDMAEPFLADPGVADEADVERYLRQDGVHDDWDDVAIEAMLDVDEMPGMADLPPASGCGAGAPGVLPRGRRLR